MLFNTVEQITENFIKDGWSKDTSFKELSLNDAKQNGYTFAIDGINKGKKYFKMNISNTIYNDAGKVMLFDIPIKQ